MNEQYRKISMWIVEMWQRIVAVNILNEEDARRGRLFNVLMMINMAIVIALSVTYLVMIPLHIAQISIIWVAAAFPLFYLSFSIFCIFQAKQGRVRSAVLLFIWASSIGLILAIWLMEGINSPAWLLSIWLIGMAGALLTPAFALWMTGIMVVYFLLLFIFSLTGLYTPPITLEPAVLEYFNISTRMIMLIFAVGLLTYFNMKSLRDTMDRLRTKTAELEEHRRTLEQRVIERTAELVKSNDKLDILATHDALTGLNNRMMFSQLLNRAILSAHRYNRQFAVFFLDLDRFKTINDTLGHDAGDQLLQEIAMRLKQALRAADVVARLGGDEFVILVDEVNDIDQIRIVAQKLLSAIGEPMVLMGVECRVTASIGISLYPKDAEDEQSLMKTADIAMYFAKEEGKNNFQLYSKNIQANAIERLAIETNLRFALERNEFYLHYQAKVDFKTNAIIGVEALLRWQNPYLGSVTPTQFIPVAEETKLIIPIGRWVLRTACEQNVAWQRQGLPPVCMAVNLSLEQLTDDNLIEDIRAALKDSGMAPNLLELELTESMVMHNPAHVIGTLTKIKKMGVRLAIDDFGTGYSSLAQIKHFPIDTLKVDRSFIRNIPQNVEDNAITEAIIAMGKTLSLTVIAEGVETQEQIDFLEEHACDQMQGFHFSKPIAPEQFADLLRSHVPLPQKLQ